MKNRKLIIILIINLILVLGACTTAISNDLQSLVDSFNSNDLDFQLYYIGKKEEMLNLKVEYLDTIDDIYEEKKAKNTFILVNNIDGRINITFNQLLDLKEKIETNSYQFYYVGLEQLDLFYNAGLFQNEIMDPSSLSFGYVKEGENYINVIGTWDTTANEIKNQNDLLFLELFLYEFKYVINQNQW